MSFKYTHWKPNTKTVPSKNKPIDHCAPLADDDRFVLLQDRDMDMIHRRREEILKKIKAHDNKLKKLGRIRKLGKNNTPRAVRVKMKQIMFPITIQRDEKEDHIINIIAEFDENFFGMPLAGYDPIRKKYAVDEGQQRLIAKRDRIRLGLDPDCAPEDWEEYEVDLQVIDLEVKEGVVDYSPLRLRFIIENDRKLRVSEYDKAKNEIHGKLTDSPDVETLPEYERAAERYLKLKKKGMTIVDSTDEGQMGKAGAFGAVRYLRNKRLTNEDIDNICDFFYDYMRHEPVADMQVLPVRWLFEQVTKEYHWYDKNDKTKVTEFKNFLRYLNAVCSRKNDFDEWEYFARDIHSRRMKVLKSNTGIPDEYSMLLLIQILQQAGYTFPGIDPVWYTTHTEVVSGWDMMRQEEKDLFL